MSFTLPLHIRQSQSLSTFRRHLKTHYFQLAYLSLERAKSKIHFKANTEERKEGEIICHGSVNIVMQYSGRLTLRITRERRFCKLKTALAFNVSLHIITTLDKTKLYR